MLIFNGLSNQLPFNIYDFEKILLFIYNLYISI